MNADDVRQLDPLPKQVLTDEDVQRLRNLSRNGDKVDPEAWGQRSSLVENYQAKDEEVLGGACSWLATTGTVGCRMSQKSSMDCQFLRPSAGLKSLLPFPEAAPACRVGR